MFDQIIDRFDNVLRNLRGLGKITDENIQSTAREIRRILLDADVNFRVSKEFIENVKVRAEGTKVTKSVKPGEQFIKIISDELVELLGGEISPLEIKGKKPFVILMAGLQGAGKTTTCGKLAYRLKSQNQKVMMVAADIYRPAAIQQLKVVGNEAGVTVYTSDLKDPVKICQNAFKEAINNNIDVLILDTAGRLHVDNDMMEEIKGIAKSVPPSECLFVADGMTGQDAVNSAKAFSESLELTGVVLTKMDGDARGGAAVSVASVTGKPIKFIGISEKLDGLEIFDPRRVADRILGKGDVVQLVEKAQSIVDEKEAERMRERLVKNQFTLEDFQSSIAQMKKMGPMKDMLSLMPGMNRKALKSINLDDRQLLWTEAIISSMTAEERQNPQIINGSRRSRIAKGCGRPVSEINQLLKQYEQMKKMMKKFGNMKKGSLPFIKGKGMFL